MDQCELFERMNIYHKQSIEWQDLKLSSRINYNKRIVKLENEMALLDRLEAMSALNDREATILDCLYDGMTKQAIALHMGFCKRTIYKYLDSIAGQFKEAYTRLGR